MPFSDVTHPYEILIRYGEDGSLKGAHAVFQRVVRDDEGALIAAKLQPAVSLAIAGNEGMDWSALLDQVHADALDQVTALNIEKMVLEGQVADALAAAAKAEKTLAAVQQQASSEIKAALDARDSSAANRLEAERRLAETTASLEAALVRAQNAELDRDSLASELGVASARTTRAEDDLSATSAALRAATGRIVDTEAERDQLRSDLGVMHARANKAEADLAEHRQEVAAQAQPAAEPPQAAA